MGLFKLARIDDDLLVIVGAAAGYVKIRNPFVRIGCEVIGHDCADP